MHKNAYYFYYREINVIHNVMASFHFLFCKNNHLTSGNFFKQQQTIKTYSNLFGLQIKIISSI